MKVKEFRLMYRFIVILLMWICLGANTLNAQNKVLANDVTATANVQNVQNARINDESTAIMTANSASSGNPATITLNYSSVIKEGTNYYIELSANDAALLNKLPMPSSGAFGAHWYEVRLNYIEVGKPNKVQLLAKTEDSYESTFALMRLTQNKNGRYILRMAPLLKEADNITNRRYNQIVFTNAVKSGLLGAGSDNVTNVYKGYYIEETSNNVCYDVLTTQISSGPAVIENLLLAIDNSITTGSVLRAGGSLLGLGGTGEAGQIFLFEKPINPSIKQVQLKLKLSDTNLTNLGEYGASVEAYNKGVLVDKKQLTNLFLGEALYGKVTQGEAFTLRYNPGGAFDEIRVVVKQGASLGAEKKVDVYDFALVNASTEPDIIETVCTINGLFNLTTIIPQYNASNTYKFYNYDWEEITNPATVAPGEYFVKGISFDKYCAYEYVHISARQNQDYTIEGKANFSVAKGTAFTFPSYVLNFKHNPATAASIKIYDNTGTEITTPITYINLGMHYYTVKAFDSTGKCETVKRITVFVYEQLSCDTRYEKFYATNTAGWGTAKLLGLISLGSVINPAKAGNKDMSSYSTINNTLSLLGIGTTYQDLKFTETIPAGTPVTVKLGRDFKLLQLIGAVSVVGLDASGNAIGPTQVVGDAALLDLLAGENIYEYTFTPTTAAGATRPYDGVRVILGSVLGLGNNVSIYGAYINKNVPMKDGSGNCTMGAVVVNEAITPSGTRSVTLNNTALDVLWGVQDPGIGAATVLSPVQYPYLAADNDLNSAAVFNTAVSVLNKQTLTVKLKQPARSGDQIRIIIGSQNINILNLSLLGNFKVQRFMGDAPVGNIIGNDQFRLLDLNLLGLLGYNPSFKAIIIAPIAEPFDRIEISYAKLVAAELLGASTYIYDVAVMPHIGFDVVNEYEGPVNLCITKPLVIEKIDNCTTYNVSFTHKVTNAGVDSFVDIPNSVLNVSSSTTDTIHYAMTQTYANYRDKLYLKVETLRGGCSFGETQYFNVRVNLCETKTISNPMIRSRMIN